MALPSIEDFSFGGIMKAVEPEGRLSECVCECADRTCSHQGTGLRHAAVRQVSGVSQDRGRVARR